MARKRNVYIYSHGKLSTRYTEVNVQVLTTVVLHTGINKIVMEKKYIRDCLRLT